MHTKEEAVTIQRELAIYQTLLFLYPELYRKRFGEEMLLLFHELYQETLVTQGKVGIQFWLAICLDTVQSAYGQHIDLMKKQGVKNYLKQTCHVNRYNVIGGILLFPFFMMFMIDLVSRIIQGDLVHYNRPVYALLSHTPLYWTPVLFTIMIVFPMLAILINLIPIITNISRRNTGIISWSFIKRNSISLVLVCIALGFIAVVKFHDFAPCMVHGILRVGVGKFPEIVSVCRNA